MIRKFIDSRIEDILRKKDPALSGVLFYAVSPFRVEGTGYTPVRTAVLCPFDSEPRDLLRRLATFIKL